MALKLANEDSLFGSGTYTITHNENQYTVDPVLFLQYSRRFATLFNFADSSIEVNDDYDEDSFSTFVKACQREPIKVGGIELINLLLVAEHWEASTLVAKIEQIIKETISPNDLLRMYLKLKDTTFPIARLEKIILDSLHRYVEDPLFAELPYEVIDRIIRESRAKIGAIQIVKLCYRIAERNGLQCLSIFKNTSFDDLPTDEVLELSQLFINCDRPEIGPFFQSMGTLLRKVASEHDSNSQFEVSWRRGEHGSAEEAYDFYGKIRETQIAQNPGVDPNNLSLSLTSNSFLRIAADKGNSDAQYQYGYILYNNSNSREDHEQALLYLMQAAAKGNQGAIDMIKNTIPFHTIPITFKGYSYSLLSLQTILLRLNKRNFDSMKSSILTLPFIKDKDGLGYLVNTLLRIVQIRQRNINLYVDLVKFLNDNASPGTSFESIKEELFQKIMNSMSIETPGPKQFVYVRFIYLCLSKGVMKYNEIIQRIVTFIVEKETLILSSQVLFYWFAPHIESFDQDVFKKLRKIRIDDYSGSLSKLLKGFRESLIDLKTNDWESFKKIRSENQYSDEMNCAIINDDLSAFRSLFNEDESDVLNDCYDFEKCESNQISIVQYAALQGSECIFTYLLQKGLIRPNDVDEITLHCAIIGQRSFICDLLTNSIEKADLFNLAALYGNMTLISNLLKEGWKFADKPKKGVFLRFFEHQFTML